MITKEKGTLFDTLGSYCGEPDGDSDLKALFRLDADFTGEWSGHLGFEMHLLGVLACMSPGILFSVDRHCHRNAGTTPHPPQKEKKSPDACVAAICVSHDSLFMFAFFSACARVCVCDAWCCAADGKSVTSWSGKSVKIELTATKLDLFNAALVDNINVEMGQNATGAGFFPSRKGYGYECDGEEAFGSTSATGDVKVVMTNTRFQAFNMNSTEVAPGPDRKSVV